MADKKNIYFKGSDTVLSNFYSCTIDYKGIGYKSVEHAYQVQKAILHYEYDLANSIYRSSDAYAAKSISKEIQCSPEWFSHKLEFMDNLITEKYHQVPLFRQYLEETNKFNLIHNVNDDFWGTGDGCGQNQFGRLLMDIRDRLTPRLKICVFGSSYVKRLYKWCAGDFKIPSVVRCHFRGGMKASAVPSDLLDNMLRMKPDVVFLQIGGNDISKFRHPGEIVGDIKCLVESLNASGVRDVFIGEVLKRGEFSKSPGLDLNYFSYCRKYINRRLEKLFGRHVVFFPNIRFPRDYADDKVHLNDSGLKTYHLKLRRLFLSLTK